jgi:hypothetical protein
MHGFCMQHQAIGRASIKRLTIFLPAIWSLTPPPPLLWYSSALYCTKAAHDVECRTEAWKMRYGVVVGDPGQEDLLQDEVGAKGSGTPSAGS